MSIDKAIEFNSALKKELLAKGMPTFADALDLGIEALKAIKKGRQIYISHPVWPLPGETEE
jgi:hypothetical protein